MFFMVAMVKLMCEYAENYAVVSAANGNQA